MTFPECNRGRDGTHTRRVGFVLAAVKLVPFLVSGQTFWADQHLWSRLTARLCTSMVLTSSVWPDSEETTRTGAAPLRCPASRALLLRVGGSGWPSLAVRSRATGASSRGTRVCGLLLKVARRRGSRLHLGCPSIKTRLCLEFPSACLHHTFLAGWSYQWAKFQ